MTVALLPKIVGGGRNIFRKSKTFYFSYRLWIPQTREYREASCNYREINLTSASLNNFLINSCIFNYQIK